MKHHKAKASEPPKTRPMHGQHRKPSARNGKGCPGFVRPGNPIPLNMHTGKPRRWMYGAHEDNQEGNCSDVNDILQIAEALVSYPVRSCKCPINVLRSLKSKLELWHQFIADHISEREQEADLTLTAAEKRWCELEDVPEEDFLTRKRI